MTRARRDRKNHNETFIFNVGLFIGNRPESLSLSLSSSNLLTTRSINEYVSTHTIVDTHFHFMLHQLVRMVGQPTNQRSYIYSKLYIFSHGQNVMRVIDCQH